jgi:hypothetical protein
LQQPSGRDAAERAGIGSRENDAAQPLRQMRIDRLIKKLYYLQENTFLVSSNASLGRRHAGTAP